MLERIEEEQRERLNRARPLEDPYLVGEEAAARARAERVAREERGRVEGNRGEEVLVRENRRWDLFLGESAFAFLFFFLFVWLCRLCGLPPCLPLFGFWGGAVRRGVW
jgi:hypothetical protein